MNAKKYLEEKRNWKQGQAGMFDFNGMVSYLEDFAKDLQHHKDTTTGLYAFDQPLEKIFENIPDKEGCKTAVEAHLVQQIEYLKSIVFQIK